MDYKFTQDSVAVMLNKLSGNTFIGLTTETIPKLTGGMKNPMQGEITKRTVSSVQVFTNDGGSSYAAKVQRRLDSEGEGVEFKLSPRAWGERIQGTPFVTHKGNVYLEVIFNKVIGTPEYFRNGKLIAKADIEGLPAAKPEGKQGGLDDKVIIRTYNLDSIRELRAFGEEYVA